MNSGNIALSFVQEFVIGFGFLSGLWIYVGVDPETEVVKAFASAVHQIAPGYSFLFWLIPVVTTIGSWLGSYFIGGWLRVIAVLFAFGGGILIGSFGIWLLIAGIVLGFLVPYTRS